MEFLVHEGPQIPKHDKLPPMHLFAPCNLTVKLSTAEDNAHLSHTAWRKEAGTHLEAPPLLICYAHSPRRKITTNLIQLGPL